MFISSNAICMQSVEFNHLMHLISKCLLSASIKQEKLQKNCYSCTMKATLILCAVLAVVGSSAIEKQPKAVPKEIHEDAMLLTPELVQKYGYPCEKHTVTTSDGYVLEIHRIPYGRNGPSKHRPAVLLQHGLLMSSGDWIVSGPEKGLGYILADNGYDVWMGNVRGNRYSRRHVSLDPDEDKTFWDFSWHEIGVYDLPAVIDYILNETEQEELFYIGHSQGTAAFYIMGSEIPDYNDKIKAAFHLAPLGYQGNISSVIVRLWAMVVSWLEHLANLHGTYEFLPNTGLAAIIGDLYCSDSSATQANCINFLFSIVGSNEKQLNTTLLPILMGHTPAGSSMKQNFHFLQAVNSGRFRQYDYGMGNIIRYGQLKPPSYKLNNVKAPIYLYYSRNDNLSHEKDVLKLGAQLPNVQETILVADHMFNHIDYCYAVDAPKILYSNIIEKMRKH